MNNRRHTYDSINSRSFRRSVPGIWNKDQIYFLRQYVYMYVYIFNLYLGVCVRLSVCLPAFLSSYLTIVSMNSF